MRIKIGRFTEEWTRLWIEILMALLMGGGVVFFAGPGLLSFCLAFFIGAYFGNMSCKSRVNPKIKELEKLRGFLAGLRAATQAHLGGGRGYIIGNEGRSITCLGCLRTSHHPKDVEHKYCDRCNKFHEKV